MITFISVSTNNHRYIPPAVAPSTHSIAAERYNHLPSDARLDCIGSNIGGHCGNIVQESTGSAIDIFGFTSGSPLPPPSPAPPTTNNTQYSLLGGTTPSTVCLNLTNVMII